METRSMYKRSSEKRALCDIVNALSVFADQFKGPEAEAAYELQWRIIEAAAAENGLAMSPNNTNRWHAFEANGKKGREILEARSRGQVSP